jgi:two-component system response regulator AtoC
VSRSSGLELVVVAGDAVIVEALLAHGVVTLGQGEECEVRIDNRSVSRRHAILHLGPPLRIQDLGSANGTFVRDSQSPTDTAATHPLRRLSRETLELAIGERVNLGSIPIVIRSDKHGKRALAADPVVCQKSIVGSCSAAVVCAGSRS